MQFQSHSHNLPASIVFCVHPRTSCKISWAQPKRDQRCAISDRWPKLKSLDLRLCTLPPFIIRFSFCLSLPLLGVQGRFNLLLTSPTHSSWALIYSNYLYFIYNSPAWVPVSCSGDFRPVQVDNTVTEEWGDSPTGSRREIMDFFSSSDSIDFIALHRAHSWSSLYPITQ